MFSRSATDSECKAEKRYQSSSDCSPREGKHHGSEIRGDVQILDRVVDCVSVDDEHDLRDKSGASNEQQCQEGHDCRDDGAHSGAERCQADENRDE